MRREKRAGITACNRFALSLFRKGDAKRQGRSEVRQLRRDFDFKNHAVQPLRESKRMNKGEFVSAVADASELSKADAASAVDAMVSVITETLKNGDSITLVGFGTFQVRNRAARQGRNPKTGEAIKIKASNNPAFKAGKALKDAVN